MGWLRPLLHRMEVSWCASVNRMTSAGNEVHFDMVRSCIQSPRGRKAHLRKRNGVYILDVMFLNGLVSEYQQYQDATAEEEGEFDEDEEMDMM